MGISGKPGQRHGPREQGGMKGAALWLHTVQSPTWSTVCWASQASHCPSLSSGHSQGPLPKGDSALLPITVQPELPALLGAANCRVLGPPWAASQRSYEGEGQSPGDAATHSHSHTTDLLPGTGRWRGPVYLRAEHWEGPMKKEGGLDNPAEYTVELGDGWRTQVSWGRVIIPSLQTWKLRLGA